MGTTLKYLDFNKVFALAAIFLLRRAEKGTSLELEQAPIHKHTEIASFTTSHDICFSFIFLHIRLDYIELDREEALKKDCKQVSVDSSKEKNHLKLVRGSVGLGALEHPSLSHEFAGSYLVKSTVFSFGCLVVDKTLTENQTHCRQHQFMNVTIHIKVIIIQLVHFPAIERTVHHPKQSFKP